MKKQDCEDTQRGTARCGAGMLLCVLLLLPVIQLHAQSGGTLGQGLTGWWTFDDDDILWTSPYTATVLDWSGNGHTITLEGFSQSAATVAGKVGQCLSFNRPRYVSTRNAMSNFMSAGWGTISVWFYALPGNTGNGSDGSLSPFFTDTYGYIWFGYDGANLCAGAFDGGERTVTTPVGTGQWIHAVWVHSSGALYLYKNGVLVGSTPLGNITDLTHALLLGRSWDGNYFSGYLDDVRAYVRALSPAEVQALYNGENGGTLDQGLTGWWTMDSSDIQWTSTNAATMVDRSGNGRTAYLQDFSQSDATVDGKFGQALRFTGHTSRSGFPLAEIITSSAGTISLWFYPTLGNTGAGPLINDFGVPGDWTWPDVWVSCSGSGLSVGGFDGTNCTVFSTVPAGQWIHAAWVHCGGILRLYTNGVEAGSTVLGNLADLSQPVWLGRSWDGNWESWYGNYFSGYLDELRTYNRALSAAEVQQLYLLGPEPPSITTSPQSRTASVGDNVAFNVTATGTPPLSYQWRKNGVNIAGATNSTLTLNSVGAFDSDGYSVVVWNDYGSAVSATAYLAVLADGANGNQPTQVSAPPAPSKPPAVDSLVLVTHGWDPLGLQDLSWITNLANAIQAKAPPNYIAVPLNWSHARGAWFPEPDVAVVIGATVGALYAKAYLIPQQWNHVHLIGHSAGAAVIESMAKMLRSAPNPPEIHETFLDPYTSLVTLVGRDIYGVNADWADSYSELDWLDIAPRVFGFGNSTYGGLDHAYNVDVSWVDPSHETVAYGSGAVALSSHGYARDFYLATVVNTDANWCAAGDGYPLSKEGGGWNNNPVSYPVGANPVVACGPMSAGQNASPARTYKQLLLDVLAYALSGGGASVSGGSGFTLTSSSTQKQVETKGGSPAGTGTPAWLAVAVPVTNAVNFVQFDAAFSSTNAAEGLLTVYWNTNEIGMVDERVASPGLQTCRFALPGKVTNGLYTLSFRLDAFNNTSTSIAVTNVLTGFAGVDQPITLAISLTNGAPLLRLTAASNFNYLAQCSTNLVDWTPAALLVNTNGTVSFADLTATNSSVRFYRALMP